MVAVGVGSIVWSGLLPTMDEWNSQLRVLLLLLCLFILFFPVVYNQKSSSTEIEHRSGLRVSGSKSSFAGYDFWASCDISLHFNFPTCEIKRDTEKQSFSSGCCEHSVRLCV